MLVIRRDCKSDGPSKLSLGTLAGKEPTLPETTRGLDFEDSKTQGSGAHRVEESIIRAQDPGLSSVEPAKVPGALPQ